ncbi:DUF3800 domain-containing protein [Halomonas sp. EF61]|uniref:DUF3800 domain-containing protein n=1 Tax=Halomonas sp. EF61 TaxID=2950869 RepID=UPI0032DF36F5
MQRLIFLDESGDLGWKFDAPFGQGGSSRHITIASAFTCIDAKKHLARTVKKLKKEAGWPPRGEMKWVDMPHRLRIKFCQKAVQLCVDHPTIEYHAIVVAKQGVFPWLRSDDSMLYNYFIKCSLLNPITACSRVTLIPDPRGIAPNSGNPLDIYLRQAIFERQFHSGGGTQLGIKQIDSSAEMGIQFADMLAGAIQLHYEGKTSDYYNILKPCLSGCFEYFFQNARREAVQSSVMQAPY